MPARSSPTASTTATPRCRGSSATAPPRKPPHTPPSIDAVPGDRAARPRRRARLRRALDRRSRQRHPAHAARRQARRRRWPTIAALDRDHAVLSRDIAALDLRLPGPMIVRLTDEGVVARKAALKERDKIAGAEGRTPDGPVRHRRSGARLSRRGGDRLGPRHRLDQDLLPGRAADAGASRARRCAGAPMPSRSSASATSARAASSRASSPTSTRPSRRSASRSTRPSAWPASPSNR